MLSLVDFKSVWQIFRNSKKDFLVWFASFLGVMLFGVEIGLGIAVVWTYPEESRVPNWVRFCELKFAHGHFVLKNTIF